ncbi:peritrophin [Penaeus vannamei]|uniref:Peritrophin n=1 Tax=Penaeus vannamei TaxID=6689 RepID=A0A423SGW4_PENVA|nr:peritrophin [Penaeus vannamei]
MCEAQPDKFICVDCKTMVQCVKGQAFTRHCIENHYCSKKPEFGGGVCYPDEPQACKCEKANSFRVDLYDPQEPCNPPENYKCPDGMVFDEATAQCQTGNGLPQCTRAGTFANPANCSVYYSCIGLQNGWLQKSFQCNSGLMYNKEKGACEDPCLYQFVCKQEGRYPDLLNQQNYFECYMLVASYGSSVTAALKATDLCGVGWRKCWKKLCHCNGRQGEGSTRSCHRRKEVPEAVPPKKESTRSCAPKKEVPEAVPPRRKYQKLCHGEGSTRSCATKKEVPEAVLPKKEVPEAVPPEKEVPEAVPPEKKYQKQCHRRRKYQKLCHRRRKYQKLCHRRRKYQKLCHRRRKYQKLCHRRRKYQKLCHRRRKYQKLATEEGSTRSCATEKEVPKLCHRKEVPEAVPPEKEVPEAVPPKKEVPEAVPPEKEVPEAVPPEKEVPEAVPPEKEVPEARAVRKWKGTR